MVISNLRFVHTFRSLIRGLIGSDVSMFVLFFCCFAVILKQILALAMCVQFAQLMCWVIITQYNVMVAAFGFIYDV